MTAIKRNLKYWGYSIEMLLVPVLGVMAMLGLFEYMGDGLEAALDYLLNFMPMMCTILMAMLGFVGVGTYFPFSMSMGSTRKASFVGMQMMTHVMAVQIVLLTAVLNIVYAQLYGTGKTPYTLVTYAFWVFLSGGICNVISAISIKCGRVWATAAYILFAVIGGIALTVMLRLAEKGDVAFGVQLICLAGSIVFDILMGFVCFLAIRKYEVRV